MHINFDRFDALVAETGITKRGKHSTRERMKMKKRLFVLYTGSTEIQAVQFWLQKTSLQHQNLQEK